MPSSHTNVMLDASVLLDDEALEFLEEQISETSASFLVSSSFINFVKEYDDYREFRKAAPIQYYYDSEYIPEIDYILEFIKSDRVEAYDFNQVEHNGEFGKQELENQIVESTSSFYPNLPAYDYLVDLLYDQIGYLFTSSLLLAAKDKISETIERVNGMITRVGSELQEPAMRQAVRAHNLHHNIQEKFSEYDRLVGEKIKLGIIALPLSAVDVQLSGGLAIAYEVFNTIAEDSLSNRMIMAIDP